MLGSVEFFVGFRYIRARKRNSFLSFISVASILGIGLGVATLIVVLSVMNGFEKELRERILGMASHATISGADAGVPDWPLVAKIANENPDVAAAAPYIEGEALLRAGDRLAPSAVRGISPAEEAQVSEIGEHVESGSLATLVDGDYNVILGKNLAETLQVGLGDKVDLMIARFVVTPAGVVPRFRRFTVSGIFNVGVFEFDNGLALISLHDAGALFQLGGNVTGVRLKLHDLLKAPQVSRQVAREVPDIYFVSDWTRNHSNYFRAVASQKQVMFLILSMLVALATFNIVSTLVMVVQDKQSDIAILRTLGATPRSVMAIFMVQGTLIGVAGTLLGLALGVPLAINVPHLLPLVEQLIGYHFLDPKIYMIDELPSHVALADIVNIASLSLALGFLSTIYPAWRASKVPPAEALRYE